MMRRVMFFLNPLLMERRGRRAIVDRCAAMLRRDGCTVEMQDTVPDLSVGEDARAAVESGFDAMFACGGDGTLFQVLQGVAGSNVAIGVIPVGTGNVLAQNLRLPRDPLAAFTLQRNAKAVAVPLGEVTCRVAAGGQERSWYFVLAAGIGMHAAVMNLAPNGSGKRRWGRAAYYAGGLRLLLRHPIQAIDVKVKDAAGDETRFRACELLAVRVPKIGLWRAGGELHSGRLRMAAVPHTGRAGLAHASFHALATTWGNRKSRLCFPRYADAIEIACAPVERFSQEHPVLVEADGEVIGVGAVTFKMSEKRVRLLWPNRVKP
ncbi:MAG TPA: diacylglycerol kinase family protein [Silvibacterium sp.]|nr:diacylglycerol kinase family protein [Silvibacterium sp.]